MGVSPAVPSQMIFMYEAMQGSKSKYERQEAASCNTVFSYHNQIKVGLRKRKIAHVIFKYYFLDSQISFNVTLNIFFSILKGFSILVYALLYLLVHYVHDFAFYLLQE